MSTISSVKITTLKSNGELIQELTGYSNSYISLVLSGKRKNQKIEQIADDILNLQQIIIVKNKA